MKVSELKSKDYKVYKKELQKRNVYSYLLEDTIGRKTKKRLLKISPKVYYKVKGKK